MNMNRTTLIVLRDIGDMYDMNICSYASVFLSVSVSLVPGAVVSSSGKRRRVWEGGSSRPCHTPLSPIEWPSDHISSLVKSRWLVSEGLYQGCTKAIPQTLHSVIKFQWHVSQGLYQGCSKTIPQTFTFCHRASVAHL